MGLERAGLLDQCLVWIREVSVAGCEARTGEIEANVRFWSIPRGSVRRRDLVAQVLRWRGGAMVVLARLGSDQISLIWVRSSRSDPLMGLFGSDGAFSWVMDGELLLGGAVVMAVELGADQGCPIWADLIRSDLGLTLFGRGGALPRCDREGSMMMVAVRRFWRCGAGGGSSTMIVVGVGQTWLALWISLVSWFKVWAWALLLGPAWGESVYMPVCAL